jgi:hypothetical protein
VPACPNPPALRVFHEGLEIIDATHGKIDIRVPMGVDGALLSLSPHSLLSLSLSSFSLSPSLLSPPPFSYVNVSVSEYSAHLDIGERIAK